MTNRYILDGARIDLEEFLSDNAEAFDAETIAKVRALPAGGEMTFGGGAAPVFVLRCERSDDGNARP